MADDRKSWRLSLLAILRAAIGRRNVASRIGRRMPTLLYVAEVVAFENKNQRGASLRATLTTCDEARWDGPASSINLNKDIRLAAAVNF